MILLKQHGIKFLSLCFFFVFVLNYTYGQELNKTERDSINTIIDSIFNEDQKYRWMIMFNTDNLQKVDSLRGLSNEASWAYIISIAHSKSKNQELEDSLLQLQNVIDSLNCIYLLNLFSEHGYIESINYTNISTIFLHTPENFRKRILDVIYPLIGKRKFPPLEYAIIYDKFKLLEKEDELYHVITFYDDKTGISKISKPKDCMKTNTERKLIGLKKIKCE